MARVKRKPIDYNNRFLTVEQAKLELEERLATSVALPIRTRDPSWPDEDGETKEKKKYKAPNWSKLVFGCRINARLRPEILEMFEIVAYVTKMRKNYIIEQMIYSFFDLISNMEDPLEYDFSEVIRSRYFHVGEVIRLPNGTIIKEPELYNLSAKRMRNFVFRAPTKDMIEGLAFNFTEGNKSRIIELAIYEYYKKYENPDIVDPYYEIRYTKDYNYKRKKKKKKART